MNKVNEHKAGEKHYNHKWGRRGGCIQSCERCKCEKRTFGLSPVYVLNGETYHYAPSCIKPVRKKYPPKYGRMPRKPKGNAHVQ